MLAVSLHGWWSEIATRRFFVIAGFVLSWQTRCGILGGESDSYAKPDEISSTILIRPLRTKRSTLLMVFLS